MGVDKVNFAALGTGNRSTNAYGPAGLDIETGNDGRANRYTFAVHWCVPAGSGDAIMHRLFTQCKGNRPLALCQSG